VAPALTGIASPCAAPQAVVAIKPSGDALAGSTLSPLSPPSPLSPSHAAAPAAGVFLSSPSSSGASLLQHPWKPKSSLRSHTDVVRAVCFDQTTPTLLASASDDGTAKLWAVAPQIGGRGIKAQKLSSANLEPVATFRGHMGPVLCVSIKSGSGQVGADPCVGRSEQK
jgi:WD40 repeat protein